MSPRAVQDDLSHPAPLGTFLLSWYGDILIKFRHKRKRVFTRSNKSGRVQTLLFHSHQLETMTSRFVKTAAVILLGLVLAWQSVPTVSTGLGVGAPKASCCCSGCDFKHCATPACCAKPCDNRAPVTPASLPISQNEWLVLATTISSSLIQPRLQADELHANWPTSASVTAVPLFQRDCCYLI